MEFQLNALVMGTQSGKKKSGEDFFKVDLYANGVGAFDKSVSAGEFVKYASMPAGTPIVIGLKLVVEEQQIKSGERSFSVRKLGVRVGDAALPENARKAG